MKVALVANTDWYLFGYRFDLAKTLRQGGLDVTLISPSGEYVQALRQAGFAWRPVALTRGAANLFAEIRGLLDFFKLYRGAGYHIVHHFTIRAVIYGSLAAKFAGIKRIVNSITGLGHLFTNQSASVKLLRWIVLPIYKWSLSGTHVIFQNDDDKLYFETNKLVPPKQAHVIYGSGVDVAKFQLTNEPAGTPQVILASRLLWEKGVGEFVKAAEMLIGKGVKARFILVGETDPGNPSSIPRETIEAWQEQEIVEWFGWQANMPDIYSASHIVCLPSYREGLPKALIEAAACGRAVVAADVPGCRQVVQDGVNGLLVPAKDAAALAAALERMIADPALRRKMGVAARQIVEERFSTQKINQQTLQIYRGN